MRYAAAIVALLFTLPIAFGLVLPACVKGVSVEPVPPDPGKSVAAKICATVEASAAPSGAPAVGK